MAESQVGSELRTALHQIRTTAGAKLEVRAPADRLFDIAVKSFHQSKT